ncbi:hypothetical protein Ct61P_10431 [Colletotrichum tofieldiae]|nr:hypothetical protein Ct61P_10431 [Colletotrichum tofieldiae]
MTGSHGFELNAGRLVPHGRVDAVSANDEIGLNAVSVCVVAPFSGTARDDAASFLRLRDVDCIDLPSPPDLSETRLNHCLLEQAL